MALVFQSKYVGTAKLHDAANIKKTHTIPGVQHNAATPDIYEVQINKLLAIGGKSVVADEATQVTQVRGAVDDGN